MNHGTLVMAGIVDEGAGQSQEMRAEVKKHKGKKGRPKRSKGSQVAPRERRLLASPGGHSE